MIASMGVAAGSIAPPAGACGWRGDNPAVVRHRSGFSVDDGVGLVEREGIVLGFPSDDLALTSLWEAVVGRPEVRVFERDEKTGKRVLTPQLRHVWSLKNHLGEKRLACVGSTSEDGSP